MRLLPITTLLFSFGASLCAAPSITGVYNAGSWIPPSLPNSGVAQGAIFTIYGSGLGPATIQYAESYPLPTTQGLAGTTIQVTVGAVTQTCIMLYTVANQAAGVLPSATPLGAGTITVTYQGTKSSMAIQVVAADFGVFTLNQNGTGPAVVTDPSFNPITYVNAAHPGDTLILWGTGLGAVTGDETQPPQSVDLGTGVQVFIEGQPATVLYGGRSSSAGLDQINFVVPSGISGGCKTSIAVLVKGVVGNVASTSIAPAGQTTCGDTHGALTAANLQTAVATGSLTLAGVELTRFGSNDDEFTSTFSSYPLSSLIASWGGTAGPSIGSCVSYELVDGSSLSFTDPIRPTYLDAGPSLALTGPAGSKTVAATSTGLYDSVLGTSSSVYIKPGTYSVSNGNGGANVAAFNWNLTLPAPVTATNIPASFSRANDLTLTWTGGAAFPVVSIIAYSGVPISTTQNSYIEFICNASGSAGQFTIPPTILSLLPTNGYGAFAVPGVALQVAGIASNNSTVAGSPGIAMGIFEAFTANGGIAKPQ